MKRLIAQPGFVAADSGGSAFGVLLTEGDMSCPECGYSPLNRDGSCPECEGGG
tara:strand:- start:396 stop:554 length:159 start_codon:yes stop_codon:yes gene_type:complete